MKKVFGKFTNETIAVTSIVFLAYFYRIFHLTSIGWIESDGTRKLLGTILTCNSVFHFSDAAYYQMIAENYLKGAGMSIPFPPPMTVWFLIAIFSLFGKNFFVAKIIYSLLGSLALIPVYLIGREIFGKEIALITTALCSVSFTLIAITSALNIENLYLFTAFLSLSIFVLLYSEKMTKGKYKLPLAFIFGISSATATLTRSEFVLIVFILFFFGLLKRGWSIKTKTQIFISAFAGFVLLITPWAVRNYHYMKVFNAKYPKAHLPLFVPVALNGSFNFLEGHNKNATGTYAPYVTGDVEGGYFSNLDPNNQKHLAMLRDGYKIGWEFIKNNISFELSLIPKKLVVFLNGFSNGFFLNNFPAGLEGEIPNMADSFIPKSKLALLLGFALFCFGFYELTKMKNKGSIRFLPIFVLAVPLCITIVFYGLSRMVYPLLPFYYMIISVGLYKLPLMSGLFKQSGLKLFTAFLVFSFVIGFWYSSSLTIILKGNSRELGRHTISVRK